MLNRRTFLSLTVATAALLALGERPRAFAQGGAQGSDRASAFVKGVTDQLTGIVNAPGSDAEKRRKLTQVIEASVEVDAIARFCLGRHWRTATPEQQQQYTRLFHDVLVTSITGHVGEYRGVRVTMGRSLTRGENAAVMTTVERPNNPPAQVEWEVANANSAPKIVDVIAEGTSLRLTQRSDYASYLARNGDNVQALIDAMRQQVGTRQSG